MSKTIVITGAAEGLGKTIAKRLVKDNKVIILDTNEELLLKTASELNCESIVCDVSDPQQVKSTIEKIIENHETIDVLINNAGIWIEGLLENSDDEKIERTFEVNCLGAIYMSKYVLPSMKQKNEGTIINIVSVSGLIAKAARSVYNSSKWAMTGFTKCLQEDLKGTNLRVMGMYPSFMKTTLFENAGIKRDDYDKALDPDELAKTIEFVLSLDPTTSFPEIEIRNIKY